MTKSAGGGDATLAGLRDGVVAAVKELAGLGFAEAIDGVQRTAIEACNASLLRRKVLLL